MSQAIEDVQPNAVSGVAHFLTRSTPAVGEESARIEMLARDVRTSGPSGRAERIGTLVDLIVGDLEP